MIPAKAVATSGGNTRGEYGGDMRAGLARVHAEKDARVSVFAAKINGQGAAAGIKRGVVERRSAGKAANAVSAEELFSHGIAIALKRTVSLA